MILISQDMMTKNALGMRKSNSDGTPLAFSLSFTTTEHFPVVRYPTKASLEICIDFSGVLFASPAPHAFCLTHLFSHLSLFSQESYACTLLFPLQREWKRAKYDCIV